MRKYLPQLPELTDRLGIVTLKSIILGCKDPEKKKVYEQEARLIMHDINLLMNESKAKIKDWGQFIRAIQVQKLANRLIWENETLARQGGRKQDHLLPFTHSINSLRMRAGNVIVNQVGGQKDLNLDRLVDEITIERGYDFGGLFE